MARYTDAKCRLCRRRIKLYLKGDRCYTDKCAVARSYAPGQHGQGRRKCLNMTYSLREAEG